MACFVVADNVMIIVSSVHGGRRGDLVKYLIINNVTKNCSSPSLCAYCNGNLYVLQFLCFTFVCFPFLLALSVAFLKITLNFNNFEYLKMLLSDSNGTSSDVYGLLCPFLIPLVSARHDELIQ